MRRLADRVRALLPLLGPLGAGARVLLLRLIGRFGWKTVLIGAGVLVYAADRYRKWIALGVVLLCAAAWMHAPESTARPADEPVGEGPTDPDLEDVVDLVRDLIGDDRGVLLTALRGPLHAADTRAVREALAAAGMRVREGVRTGGGNGPGVHRDDLPPLSPPSTEAHVGGVVAGQHANTNANNTLRVQSREGMTIITDPADRHRTHTLKKP